MHAIAVSVVSAGLVCFTCRVIDLWASDHVACGVVWARAGRDGEN